MLSSENLNCSQIKYWMKIQMEKRKIFHAKMKIGEQRIKISKVEMQISNQPMIW